MTNRVLLAILALCSIVVGIFFTIGYIVGRRTAHSRQAAESIPVVAATKPQEEIRTRRLREMQFVLVSAGEFTMGFQRGHDDGLFDQIAEEAASRADNPAESWFPEFRKEIVGDCPSQRVRITHPFELSKYEVSTGQWHDVMDPTHGSDSSSDYPISNVTWYEVQVFLQRMNERRDGYRYRLPTEAEWEYAARAGTTGDSTEEMYLDAWDFLPGERGMSVRRPVDLDSPNAWGFYNMLGNVSEWVADWYGKRRRQTKPLRDPEGPPIGHFRVVRGGSNYDVSYTAFVWSRAASSPEEGSSGIGFRCAREKISE